MAKPIKVMQKRYYLVNQNTNQRMIVYPERWCGLDRDNHKKVDRDGNRQRIFKVLEDQGVDLTIFDSSKRARPDDRVQSDEIVLYNKGGSWPRVEVNDEVWQLELIPGEQAKKPRKPKPAVASV